MAKYSSLLSRLIQLTAFIFFIYALYRLYVYFTNWVLPPEYMIYTIFTAIVIGISVLIHDDVFKPGSEFVGWAFLFGVGFLSLLFGTFFVFFPELKLDNEFTGIWPRAFFFLLMGLILITESLLVRREVVPGKHGLTVDTIGPVVLKFAATFAFAWGCYQMSWVIVPFLRDVPLLSMLPLFFAALANLLSGSLLVIYVETQKRRPHFRGRRFPLMMGFILLLLILPLIAFYFTIFMTIVPPNIELLFNAIISLGVAIALIITSFYIVNHPTKAR